MQLEALQAAAAAGRADGAMLADEARTLLSQIRMWGKDGERRAEGSWLGWLEDLRKGL